MAKRIGLAVALLVAAAPIAHAQDAVDRLDMKAHAAFDAKDYDQAIECWSGVIKLDPNDSTAWYNRGMAYEDKGAPDKALGDYSEAIRLEPADAQNYVSRAAIYRQLQQMDKAIEDYSAVIKLDPKSSESYELRGVAYRDNGQLDKAILDYQEMIQLNPADPEGYTLLGAAHSMTGDWDKVIADFTLLLKNMGNPWYGYMLRGQAYFNKGDNDKAIADLNNALQLNQGDDPDIIFSIRGGAYASKGEYDKAIEDFNHIMTANPGFAEGFNAMAWLYATCPKAEVRNGAKAMELAIKACQMSDWKNASFLDTLAAAEAECGKWDDAVKHAKQAVEAGKAAKESDLQIKDYASRIPLYEQKQPYRDLPKKP